MSICLGCEKESEEDEEYEQCHKCLDIECDECEENMERRSGLPYFLVCPCGKTSCMDCAMMKHEKPITLYQCVAHQVTFIHSKKYNKSPHGKCKCKILEQDYNAFLCPSCRTVFAGLMWAGPPLVNIDKQMQISQ